MSCWDIEVFRNANIKIRTKPYYDCSCGKTYTYKRWAMKHAATHNGTVTVRQPFEGGNIGRIYLIDECNVAFKEIKP